jgi:hypothetical protein
MEPTKEMIEPEIKGYEYDVVAQETMLLVGKSLECAEDVPGWNINLVKNELWSDGDRVTCNVVSITSTTDESEVKRLKTVVKDSAVFAIAFELGISHFEAYKLFRTA